MNIWKIASRWSDTGQRDSSILDVFVKNGIAFIHPEDHNLEGIEIGDLIAISDGRVIVAVAEATTRARKIRNFSSVRLSEADLSKIDYCHNEIEGVRIHLPREAILGSEKGIHYPHIGRFCNIGSSEVASAVRTAWKQAEKTENEADFDIKAQARTFNDLLADKKTRLYMIPIFQRPYDWGETELEQFLEDLLSSYRKNKRMFIGTMQLSAKRCLSPRGEFFQEVIDGQQRITTCALILKVLSLMNPENAGLRDFCRDFTWIESRVNSGQQQKRLDDALRAHSVDNPSEGGINRYLDNCHYILRFLSDRNATEPTEQSEEEPLRRFSVDAFFRHMVNELRFVVIETLAGLSETIRIFNIINTTGLDLNGGDLFKIRAFEYLTDCRGESPECFDEISSLYEHIDRNAQELQKKYTGIQEILGVYQKILSGRNRLPVDAVRLARETFYERFFDSVLGLKNWENFKHIREVEKNASEPLIRLSEIEKLIQIRHDFEKIHWNHPETSFDVETRLAFYLIEWSRYSGYWTLFLVVEFCYPDASNLEKWIFVQALAKLFVVFSIIYGKQVYEIHGFMTELTEEMVSPSPNEPLEMRSLAQITEKIKKRTEANRESFKKCIQGDLANYRLPKDLICRLLEALESRDSKKLYNIFIYGYDIEHIQSYHHEDPEKRDQTWQEWGSLLNSIGNLMLLQTSVNRSIGNKPFTEKKKVYKKSIFAIAQKIGNRPESDWNQELAQEKLDRDSEELSNYLFNEG